MTTEFPCCQGLSQHTYGEECLLHRERVVDLSDPEQRRKAAEQIAKEVYEAGGFLRPGEQMIRLEPGERVLSQEDIQRLLEGS